MMKSAIWLILFLGGIYLAMGAFLYIFQGKLLFYPTRTLVYYPDAAGLDYEDVYLQTGDGERLHGWYVPHENRRGTLLFFHGNAGNISGRIESIRQFNQLGLDVFIIDYRGYGKSTGRPNEKGLYTDALTAYDYLTLERGIPPDSLIIFGRSLGGSVAAYLASEKPAAALALESTFTSVPDVARGYYPVFPVGLLTRYKLPTIEYLRKFEGPVLIAHSPDDELISYRFGRELYDAVIGPRQFLEMRGGHNDGFFVTGRAYTDGYDRFFTSVLGNSEDAVVRD
ncbi:MAG: alpha/beta hydrolase [Balneolaceae bacterium]|nr:MAG: alpha/beta hydrolase [Balneolaceae bacterium]